MYKQTSAKYQCIEKYKNDTSFDPLLEDMAQTSFIGVLSEKIALLVSVNCNSCTYV